MCSLYSDACEKIILPIADFITNYRVMKCYDFNKKAQWWSRDRLLEYQHSRVVETLGIAYDDVAFYKQLYDNAGVNITDIRRTEDLTNLPIVTKEMLRNAYPDGCTRKTEWPWREYSTSGSSGKPFAVRVDNRTMSQTLALMILRANYSGWRIGEPFMQTGMTLDRGVIKKYKDMLMRVQYVSAFNLSDAVLDNYLRVIETKKLNFIMGYAGSLYCLAERAAAVGFNRKIGGIVSWGDNLYGHYRTCIEQSFQCKVTDTYGCGEGIQVAAQCGENNGAYHIFMPHVVVEIVDDGGFPVSPGESGNILLTRLDAGAMPLIRYKVGDIGRKNGMVECSCGRGLETLTKIEGRDTDIVITPNGNRLIVHFFTGIMEYYHSVKTFRVTQERLGEIIMEVVPRSDFREEHWDQIKREIWEKGDPELDVKLNLVDEIGMEHSNKRRFVISKLAVK